jgi:hypothetical protein
MSIWLRAGWSLGAVQQSRYIFEGAGGDQFVGRAAAGLNINCIDFAILPPHFNSRDGQVLTTSEWNDILPGYETYPECFRVAIPYLLASLVYHSEWLQSTLPAQHPLFLQRVWTSGIISRLKSKVHLGRVFNQATGMKSTGIPPSVVILGEFSELKARVQHIHMIE